MGICAFHKYSLMSNVFIFFFFYIIGDYDIGMGV